VSFLLAAGWSFGGGGGGSVGGGDDDVQFQSGMLVRTATAAETAAFTLDLLIVLWRTNSRQPPTFPLTIRSDI